MENKKDNSFKVYIIGAVIIVVSLIIIGTSMSYAFFINRVEETGDETGKNLTITSGSLEMNFATTRTISATAVGLVNDSEVTTKAEHTDFSVTLPSDSKIANAKYTIFLTDLVISDNLKSADVKWSLYKGSSSVANGTFESIGTNTTLNLKTDITIEKGNTDNYTLYIWLSNATDRNQTELLNGSFSGKVGFIGTQM